MNLTVQGGWCTLNTVGIRKICTHKIKEERKVLGYKFFSTLNTVGETLDGSRSLPFFKHLFSFMRTRV
jgi:hypothetical protein